ncbi:MAG: hypothetical protein K0S63_171, partial [Gammaproteobacteria bacterium]|nr:hypothetical protein [Gammaproteobacteria bacterium]
MFDTKPFHQKYFETGLEKASVLQIAEKILYVANGEKLPHLANALRFYLLEYFSEKEKNEVSQISPLALSNDPVKFQRYCEYYSQLVHPIVLAIYDFIHPHESIFEKEFSDNLFRLNTTTTVFGKIVPILHALNTLITNNETNAAKQETEDLQNTLAVKVITEALKTRIYPRSFFNLLALYLGQNISRKLYIPNPENLQGLTEYSPIKLDHLIRKIGIILKTSWTENMFPTTIPNNYIIDRVFRIVRGERSIERASLKKFSELSVHSEDVRLILKDPGLFKIKISDIENLLYYSPKNGGSLTYLPPNIALAMLAMKTAKIAIKNHVEPIPRLAPHEALEATYLQHISNMRL